MGNMLLKIAIIMLYLITRIKVTDPFLPLTDTDTERQFSPTQFNELWQEGGGVEMLSKGRDYYVELGGR